MKNKTNSATLWEVHSKPFLQAVINSINDALIVTDNEENILLANPAAKIFLGIPLKTLGKKHCYDFHWLETEDGKPFCSSQCKLAHAAKNFVGAPSCPISRTLVLKQKSADKKVYIYHSVFPLFVKGKFVGNIKLFRDITPEKQLEQEKERFRQMLIHDWVS